MVAIDKYSPPHPKYIDIIPGKNAIRKSSLSRPGRTGLIQFRARTEGLDVLRRAHLMQLQLGSAEDVLVKCRAIASFAFGIGDAGQIICVLTGGILKYRDLVLFNQRCNKPQSM